MRRMLDEVTIQPRTEATSSSGAVTITWTTSNYEWPATFHPMGGRETRVLGRSYPTADGVFEMYRNPDDVLTTSHRISWDGSVYDIEYIDDVGDRGRRDRLMVVVKKNAS